MASGMRPEPVRRSVRSARWTSSSRKSFDFVPAPLWGIFRLLYHFPYFNSLPPLPLPVLNGDRAFQLFLLRLRHNREEVQPGRRFHCIHGDGEADFREKNVFFQFRICFLEILEYIIVYKVVYK